MCVFMSMCAHPYPFVYYKKDTELEREEQESKNLKHF